MIQAATLSLHESTRNISSFRRENAFNGELSVIDLDTGRTVITARFYGKALTAYCCVWAWGRASGEYGRGMGKAGGGGYHKDSAALADALADAGIKLSVPIHGNGDAAMREALEAVAHAMGCDRTVIVHAHP